MQTHHSCHAPLCVHTIRIGMLTVRSHAENCVPDSQPGQQLAADCWAQASMHVYVVLLKLLRKALTLNSKHTGALVDLVC